MSKSFFVSSEHRVGVRDESHSYTSDGRNADFEIKEALTPILDKWVDDGYSPHELLAIIVHTFSSMSSRKILNFRRERNRPKHITEDPESKCDCRECYYARGLRDGKASKE